MQIHLEAGLGTLADVKTLKKSNLPVSLLLWHNDRRPFVQFVQ